MYNKLVRDGIPRIITASGAKPVTRKLDGNEYLSALIEKLKEETLEFAESFSVEELADIQEVVSALCEAIGKTAQELEVSRKNKAKTNGAFRAKILLERVD